MQVHSQTMSNAADDIIGLYDRNAAHYDKDRLRILFEKIWLDRFLVLLPAGGAILDIGCGMAEPIARYFIDAGFSLTGVDAAPAMIGLCQSRFPDHDWRVADMRMLALGRGFDGLIAWDSFFHLTHDAQRAMFPIFRAHAAPNAALMFTSGPSHGEATGSYHGEPLYHASLDAAEYAGLLDRNGFDIVAHVANDPDCDRHTVWLARARP